MPPLVDIQVDGEWRLSLGSLRDDDLCTALVELGDDPIGVEGLVGDQAAELCALDQRCDADRVVSLAGEKNEPYEVTQRIGQRQDFGRQAPTRLANSLALSPPFAPCPWR